MGIVCIWNVSAIYRLLRDVNVVLYNTFFTRSDFSFFFCSVCLLSHLQGSEIRNSNMCTCFTILWFEQENCYIRKKIMSIYFHAIYFYYLCSVEFVHSIYLKDEYVMLNKIHINGLHYIYIWWSYSLYMWVMLCWHRIADKKFC